MYDKSKNRKLKSRGIRTNKRVKRRKYRHQKGHDIAEIRNGEWQGHTYHSVDGGIGNKCHVGGQETGSGVPQVSQMSFCKSYTVMASPRQASSATAFKPPWYSAEGMDDKDQRAVCSMDRRSMSGLVT